MATRFEVPQFIDVQDKIFGPFTMSQFLFILGGGGLGYIAYRSIPTIIKYPIALICIGFGVALAFYKVNGRPFINILQSFFNYTLRPKLYLWRQRIATTAKVPPKEISLKKAKKDVIVTAPTIVSPKHLRDLAWNLDILEQKRNQKNTQQ